MDKAAAADRIVIDGVGLETRWVGPDAALAPTIVLLHEGLGCVGLWGRFPEQLSEATGCGVLLYSRAGYGRSDAIALPRPMSYMHDEALRVLPKLLQAIGFRRGFLLGHSDGASIATIYAGSVQDHRVRGLVLLAPHFFVEDVSVASIEAAKVAFDSTNLRERLARHHGSNVDCAFRGWNDAWRDPRFRDWDIREQIAYIRVPMLIVQGTDDQYGTSAQLDAARAEAYCPVEIALLEACGHAPQQEQPDATLVAIADFIGRLMRVHGEAKIFGHR